MLALRAESSAAASGLILMKSWLIMCGIYIWEFVTTLDYEWSIIRGHQRYRWTIWIYSFSRLSCLAITIINLASFSITTEIDCQGLVTAGWFIGTLGGNCIALILIILRIFAIWDKNRVIMVISAAIWVQNAVLQFSGVVRIRAVWVSAARACTITNYGIVKGLSIGTLVTDISLLLIMLAGLLRLRHRDRAFVHLEYVLWIQGVIWLGFATAVEVPHVFLQFMNVDDSLKQLFTLLAMVIMVIAATRTYRDLTYYGSTPPNTYIAGPDSSNLPKINHIVSSTKNPSLIHTPSNQLEVTAHTTHEEYPMSQMNRCGSYPSSDARLADKPPHELGLDDDVEGRDEKK